MLIIHCTAATFYSVSISKPIPVCFGKKFKILTTRFPNQFQFGFEKNYNFDDSFSKPIPVWFGKNDHISEAKNSKLIIIWSKESWLLGVIEMVTGRCARLAWGGHVGVGGVGEWSPRSRVRLKVLLKTANFICFR